MEKTKKKIIEQSGVNFNKAVRWKGLWREGFKEVSFEFRVENNNFKLSSQFTQCNTAVN